MTHEVFFRYEQALRCDWEEYTESYHVEVVLTEFLVTRATYHGVWIRRKDGARINGKPEKFVLLNTGYGNSQRSTHKRYAHPNQKDALISFLARKRRQRFILKSQLKNVKIAMVIAKGMEKDHA